MGLFGTKDVLAGRMDTRSSVGWDAPHFSEVCRQWVGFGLQRENARLLTNGASRRQSRVRDNQFRRGCTAGWRVARSAQASALRSKQMYSTRARLQTPAVAALHPACPAQAGRHGGIQRVNESRRGLSRSCARVYVKTSISTKGPKSDLPSSPTNPGSDTQS